MVTGRRLGAAGAVAVTGAESGAEKTKEAILSTRARFRLFSARSMLANSAADGSDAGSDEWDEDALATALEDALEPARPPDIAEGRRGRYLRPPDNAPPSAIVRTRPALALPDDLLLRVLQQLPLGPLTSVAMRVCRRLRDASSREAASAPQRLLEALRAAVAPPPAGAVVLLLAAVAAATAAAVAVAPAVAPAAAGASSSPAAAAAATSPPPDVARRLAAVARDRGGARGRAVAALPRRRGASRPLRRTRRCASGCSAS